MGSLTGAVASKRVTEALKGSLSMDGNHAEECKRKSEPNCERDVSSSNERDVYKRQSIFLIYGKEKYIRAA